MVEHLEGEALSEVPLEVQLEEVVSPSEEIPSMIKLDAPQLGEVTVLIFGAESVVGSSCHEDGSHANCTSDKLVVLTGNGGQDGRVESGHEANEAERKEGTARFQAPEDRANIYLEHRRARLMPGPFVVFTI
jgi:hypothetical protein